MCEKIFLIPITNMLILLMSGALPPDASTALQQADALMKNRQYDQAEGIYMQILTDHPPAEVAFEAQKQLVIIYIATANHSQADIALEQLLTRFWGHDAIAQSLWEIATEFGKAKNNARAIELHQYNVENFTGDMYAMKSQTEIICSHIRNDDIAAASAAVNDLLSIFSQQPTLPEEIYQVAREYEKYEEYDEAFELYKYDFENFPDDIHAMMSQTGIVKYHIRRGNDAAADAAFDDLLSIFADEPTLQEQVHYVARKYEELERYDKALEIYQYNVECYPKDEYTIRSQVRIVRYYIRYGNDQVADEAFAKLVTLFSDEPTLPKEVYKIANIFNEAGNGQKARQIYQYVIDKWSDNRFAMLSQAGIALIDVSVGDDAPSQAAIDDFIADFSDHPDLPAVLWAAAELYYNRAFFYEIQGLDAQAIENFTMVTEVGRRILQEWPDSGIAAEVYHVLGNCCQHLGQYAKAIEYYQKVVDNWSDYKYAWIAQLRIAKIYKLLLITGVISDSEADATIIAAYRNIVESFPDCPAAELVRECLVHNAKPEEGGQK